MDSLTIYELTLTFILITNLIMPIHLLMLLIFISASMSCLQAGESHSHDKGTHYSHSSESNELMIAYQYGYTEIRSKNNHMPDDSGVFLGIHVMKPIDNSIFNSNLYLAAGAHTTFTEDNHIGLMLGIMYPINEKTMISIMPGLMLMKHEASHSNMNMGTSTGMDHMSVDNNEWETEEAIHIEITHTITLLNRILNPSFSWMSSSSHNHYSLGLNFHF